MYPKVKVRQEQYQDDHRVIQDNNLKALQSLSLRVSPPPEVPVSEDLGACNLTSDSSGPTGAEKDDNIDEDRVNIRASSIPPPRAVISSPGNKRNFIGHESPCQLCYEFYNLCI
ncbi:uncharacterized protein LOC114749057 isoform X2 [Neltuma alba]|uniref:uncharacterized protein LOC114749057 isoform X2 n=1 Tax=Neltuma alba TaxID=207710 RepID=UPI0010A2CCA0|nr:uncharacterized protein LOC114749057 isoform X2 [Prosopis alba]